MSKEEFFKIVKVRTFFTLHCTGVKNFYHKSRGFDGNKNPIRFSNEDKALMKAAAAKLGKELSNVEF